MTETATSRDFNSLPPGHDHRRLRAPLHVRRFALGVATGLVLAASLLAACGGTTAEYDTLNITNHLYLTGPGGTKYENSVGTEQTVYRFANPQWPVISPLRTRMASTVSNWMALPVGG